MNLVIELKETATLSRVEELGNLLLYFKQKMFADVIEEIHKEAHNETQKP